MRTRKRGQGGFTLLELLMVVIIIAILASIALPQYIRVTERARATEALQLLGTIRSAQNRFKAQNPNDAYTTLITDLDADMPAMIRFWGAPALAAGRATMARNSGAFSGTSIGIIYADGTVCGNFPPMGNIPAC